MTSADYKLKEVDVLNGDIEVHLFYRNHLSKSIPCVFRHGSSDWDLTKMLSK